MNNVWRHTGLPHQVISDRGPQFTSKVMQEVWKKLNVKSTMSTAFHPQTDGETERVNQELEQYLRVFGNFQQDNWVNLIPSWNSRTMLDNIALQGSHHLKYGT